MVNKMAKKKMTSAELKAKLEADKQFRKKIFEELCEHLKRGFSLDCFPALSDNSILEYTKTYPLEFPKEDLVDAQRAGKEGWEDIGRRQALGSCLGNSRSWYYNMANRYGWKDKLDIDADHKGQVQVEIVNYGSRHTRMPADNSEDQG